MKKKPVIFCDFDGTVTESDNIIAIMKEFAPKEWVAIKDDILAQRISIRDGVTKLFRLLPSSQKEEIVAYSLQNMRLREGFNEFVSWTEEVGTPLWIVSGGIDFFVYPSLEGLVQPENIYCNRSDFTGERIEILWPHTCDHRCQNDCGCCKVTILRQFDSTVIHRILIGDSITDLQAAKMADQVFARDFLIEKCEEQKIPYCPFETFHDIRFVLEQEEVFQPI
ncbi:2-hydroxy-3-keto-5-methylthiopentenyl-1-phosphate phosphatase [Thermoactinomyces sp. DSM 45892]|uniref:2-hydroxy-3-keto-5-methylthiopentenyl-1- phosphate phosphatase n=1 Tax=Thermoactinomyces sp. DSM 45892 TaxID=1882753 RepID=UPI00089A4EDD|nr:2-hydroxy-3-keto-5-methylthiopentenyl-1-phosphate phosphatase [Thermoactinomyces sp. DSM 45892]SDZ04216.1 2-hydroxy-3-keto-5-methylthiopentenyl-1-phosphatephosphatase [Thermoactinomyces sp. DSM 45892]